MNPFKQTLLCGFVLALLLSLAGCGNGSKQDIINKTSNAKTKQELESALGKPQNFNKLGPIETWTYKATDGEVSFLITGDTVQMQATADKKTED
jgi:hypothetical protein